MAWKPEGIINIPIPALPLSQQSMASTLGLIRIRALIGVLQLASLDMQCILTVPCPCLLRLTEAGSKSSEDVLMECLSSLNDMAKSADLATQGYPERNKKLKLCYYPFYSQSQEVAMYNM